MPIEPHDPYGDPHIYDILTSPGTEAEMEGLLAMARPTQPPDRPWRWLEPACGSGRYLRHARRHGIDVWGFDASAPMIRYARKHLSSTRRTQLWVADFTDFARRIERASIDFAFSLHNSLRHLDDDGSVRQHLAQMALCLRPEGMYAVGLDTGRRREPITEDVWTAQRADCRVTQMVQYVPPEEDRSETVLSHLVIERGSRTEHRDHVYRLRTYTVEQWRALVTNAGWAIVDVVDERGHSTMAAPFAYGIYLLAPLSAAYR